MAKSNEREPSVTPIYIGSQVSGVSVVLPGIYFRKHSRIKNVWFVDKTGIAKSSSNYVTLVLQDNAGSPNLYASIATSASAAVALTPLALAYSNDSDSAVDTELDVPAGTMLDISVVGTGTAICSNSILLVEWYPC